MHYTMELLLSDAGRKKLDKAYAKKSTYTAYWLNQKMFTYTASSTTINNLFMIPDVFNEENVFGFHDTLTIVCNMRRRLVWKNTCFSRK